MILLHVRTNSTHAPALFPSVCREKLGHAPELPQLRPRPADAPAAGPARLARRRPPRLVRDRGGRGARPRALLRLLPRRRPRRRRPRPEDDGDAARLRLRGRRALIARDRAPLPRGRRLPGDLRQPGARPRDDRPLSRPPRGALADLFGGVLGLCAKAGSSTSACSPSTAPSSPPTPPTERSAPTSRSPPRSSPRPARIDAAEDEPRRCPRRRAARASFAPATAAAPGFARPRGARARARRGGRAGADATRAERLESCRAAWPRTGGPSAARTALRGLPRARGDADGRRFGAAAEALLAARGPEGKINTTDPDSRG